MADLTVARRDTEAGPVLLVAGELDFVQAPVLRQHVAELALWRGACLTLDLSRLEQCDSAGLTVLLLARERARAAAADLVLAAPPPKLRRTLAITGLDAVFTLRPDEGSSGLRRDEGSSVA
ncbi:STAS domain-containing protein [Actinacidiphila acidipaludis]|uniref:Anti-sigma factor antagonist n=1 Tax=Actinacidiphila acidipaludis TaxID=2873382 RepID=A0ABS7QDE8_9ACTN|nr:STAS domain-containing protein [Streptomyces acidipaludis]MBY8881195.1 STAS domain-containing protein [Streptomyces acidipaludis]